MPKRKDINKVMVIGSGPIVIGQAAEFDYAGTQACLALKEEGYEVILVNSNPATIMTDTHIADKVYMEPLTLEYVAKIIRFERPDAIVPGLGGQTGLNLAVQLAKKGILKECQVEILGTSFESIERAEDRELFKELCESLGEPVIESKIAMSVEEAVEVAAQIGYPVVLRPAYTLGGTGGGFVDNEEQLREMMRHALFLSPGSTGMASGNTLDEAKVGALTEILERDAEATVPWRRDQCFTLEAHGDHPLAVLLADYARRGIHVWFRDMTTEFGVPCYQSFVTGSDGSVVRGAGAGLSGPGALLSALTETPYPYPNGPASAPVPAGLAQRRLEDLPEYRLDSPARNLRLLEAVLISHGHVPVYVDLTRDDLEIPVVRAVVPGLELTADFDVFSRPSVRLFRRYLEGK